MAVIAVIQQKGGVGPSTITANVAGELLKKGLNSRSHRPRPPGKSNHLGEPGQRLTQWTGTRRQHGGPEAVQGRNRDRKKRKQTGSFLTAPQVYPIQVLWQLSLRTLSCFR